MNKLFLISAALASAAIPHQANAYDTSRPDSHAPIQVMGDHTHHDGEWMISYRFMDMGMDGLRRGSDSIEAADAFAANYTVAPTSMSMAMHMLGAMHAISDKTTLMLMAPYLDTEMDHEIFPMAAPLIGLNDGSRFFTTSNSGWGDLKVGALHKFWESDSQRSHFGMSVGLPTGSIDEQDLIPGPGGRLSRLMPAPMQLGSGSYELRPSITFLSQGESSSWGAQANGIFRLDTNSRGYKLGNKLDAQFWAAKALSKRASLAARLAYTWQDDMSGLQEGIGQNPPFAPSRRTVTTAFSENYGGNRLDASVSANVNLGNGHRIAIEYAFPLSQDLNGIQLETDSSLTIGWQKAFD